MGTILLLWATDAGSPVIAEEGAGASFFGCLTGSGSLDANGWVDRERVDSRKSWDLGRMPRDV